MQKTKVPIAASMKDKQCDFLTSESLMNIARDAKSIPVTENFDTDKIIGRVRNIEFLSGILIAEIELSQDISLKEKIFRIQGIVKKATKRGENKDIINVVEDLELTAVGMIDKVQDVYPLNLELGMKLT